MGLIIYNRDRQTTARGLNCLDIFFFFSFTAYGRFHATSAELNICKRLYSPQTPKYLLYGFFFIKNVLWPQYRIHRPFIKALTLLRWKLIKEELYDLTYIFKGHSSCWAGNRLKTARKEMGRPNHDAITKHQVRADGSLEHGGSHRYSAI